MNQSDPTTHPTTEPECRWALKARTGAEGWVDGGWWPRSTDPGTEFPPLIAAMAALGMPVLRVSFHLGAWDAGERRLAVHDAVVELAGFRSAQRHVVTMIGPHRRTRLLVIPPATPGGAARAALRAAADVAVDATAEEILRRNNVVGKPAAPRGPRRRAGFAGDSVAS